MAGPPVTLTTGPVWHFETSRLEGALPLLKIKNNVNNSKLIVLVNLVKNKKRKKKTSIPILWPPAGGGCYKSIRMVTSTGHRQVADLYFNLFVIRYIIYFSFLICM